MPQPIAAAQGRASPPRALPCPASRELRRGADRRFPRGRAARRSHGRFPWLPRRSRRATPANADPSKARKAGCHRSGRRSALRSAPAAVPTWFPWWPGCSSKATPGAADPASCGPPTALGVRPLHLPAVVAAPLWPPHRPSQPAAAASDHSPLTGGNCDVDVTARPNPASLLASLLCECRVLAGHPKARKAKVVGSCGRRT
mmetsp:Transcript_74645/g.205811  ORF Transcript_74645/g.205811 Transcript_74645/m.205811 type:complete len:201 (+) Transcript_74645:1274-1876(+)